MTQPMRTVLIIALLLGAAVVGVGAAFQPTGAGGTSAEAAAEPPDGPPDFHGTITELQRNDAAPLDGGGTPAPPRNPDTPVSSDGHPGGGAPSIDVLGRVLVEEEPGEPWGSGKDWVTVTRETRIWRAVPGGEPEPAGFANLAPGHEVDLWYTGPIAESYPRQAIAAHVVIRAGS